MSPCGDKYLFAAPCPGAHVHQGYQAESIRLQISNPMPWPAPVITATWF